MTRNRQFGFDADAAHNDRLTTLNCRCVLNPVWGDGEPLSEDERRRINGLTRYRVDGGPWLPAEVMT